MVDKKEAKKEIKRLTGGFRLSKEYQQILKLNGLSIGDGVEIQSELKNSFKEGCSDLSEIEATLDSLIKNRGKIEPLTLVLNEAGNPLLGVGFTESLPGRMSLDQKKEHMVGFIELCEKELIVHKQSAFRKKDRGQKHIKYNQIVSVDFDKGRTLGKPGIQMYLNSMEYSFKSGDSSDYVETFYNELRARIDNVEIQEQQNNTPKNSILDELEKLGKLRDSQVITEEEFTQMKTQLLENN